MARKWTDIRKQLSPEGEQRIKQRVKDELGLSLTQLRNARHLTQENLAKLLRVNQGAISKLEQRTDAYVSTLRSYLKAMGADLQITAVFSNREVVINQFEDIDPPASGRVIAKPTREVVFDPATEAKHLREQRQEVQQRQRGRAKRSA
jgi:transcriptional regulator with XRE-family HTH domain